jgi:hypothetical protein
MPIHGNTLTIYELSTFDPDNLSDSDLRDLDTVSEYLGNPEAD